MFLSQLITTKTGISNADIPTDALFKEKNERCEILFCRTILLNQNVEE